MKAPRDLPASDSGPLCGPDLSEWAVAGKICIRHVHEDDKLGDDLRAWSTTLSDLKEPRDLPASDSGPLCGPDLSEWAVAGEICIRHVRKDDKLGDDLRA
ncbi:hypothetical protein NDU88_000847 [Pleurodeles waltl]|uniref:Uncharacterized protein n=1 Tax=Pleurodeles waltl TaxID=8319 RepID=A0AAV7V655_PLEWA|nr:hypothetical protein NDU88_000847 [Pleurodeles waltl]